MSEEELTLGDLVLDEHGLPAGRAGDVIWPHLLAGLEEGIHACGWGQPARVFALTNPQTAAANAHPAVVAAGTGGGVLPYGIVEIANFTGDPVERLWGLEAPDWAIALVLVYEGWAVGSEDTGTDGVTRQLDVRSLTLVTRSGRRYGRYRVRGDEPVPQVGDQVIGLAQDVLARMMGAATAPTPITVADALGRLALGQALGPVAQLREPNPSTLAHLAPHEIAALDQARAALRELSSSDQESMLGDLLLRTLMTSAAQVVWAATEHGSVGLSPDLADLVGEVATDGGRPRRGDQLGAIRAAAPAAASRSFTDLAGGFFSRELVPAEIAQTAGWADDGLIGRWWCWRQLDSQPELLDWAREHLGRAPARVAAEVLMSLGWASTAPAGPF